MTRKIDIVLDSIKSVKFPEKLPALILPHTVLLPQGLLSAMITSSQDLRVIDHILKTNRMIGIIQEVRTAQGQVNYFRSGCLAQLITFHDSSSGYFIVLRGLVRFFVERELQTSKPWRLFQVTYHKSISDAVEETNLKEERAKLLPLLEGYFLRHNLSLNWDEINQVSDDHLLTTLTLLCPFGAAEKQALLETTTPRDRYHMLMALIELSLHKDISNARH